MDELLGRALLRLRAPEDRNEHFARMRLALRLGVSFYTVEHWRTGRRPVGAVMRKAIEAITEETTHA